MSWLRIDDGFVDHPKVIQAGAALGRYGMGRICAVYLEGLTYASRKLTDGVLSTAVVQSFHGDPKPLTVAQTLLTFGLWDEHPAGFQIHDYLEFNESADAVKRRRVSQRDRQRTHRRQKQDVSVTSRSLAGARSPSPSPTQRSQPRTPTLTRRIEDGANGEVCARAGRFCHRYRWELYPQIRGVAYTPSRVVEGSDLDAAERLANSYTDEQLEKLASFFLQIPDDRDTFVKGKQRTIGMLLAKAAPIMERLNAR